MLLKSLRENRFEHLEILMNLRWILRDEVLKSIKIQDFNPFSQNRNNWTHKPNNLYISHCPIPKIGFYEIKCLLYSILKLERRHKDWHESWRHFYYGPSFINHKFALVWRCLNFFGDPTYMHIRIQIIQL